MMKKEFKKSSGQLMKRTKECLPAHSANESFVVRNDLNQEEEEDPELWTESKPSMPMLSWRTTATQNNQTPAIAEKIPFSA